MRQSRLVLGKERASPKTDMIYSMNTDIPDFSTARVLVVGDAMLDRYWSGPAERISPEAPVPIVRVEGVDERCGGAANVAVNLARLGAQVCLICAAGDDEPGRALASLLEGARVRTRLFGDDRAGTTVKLRLVSRQHQLMRLDFEKPVGPHQVGEIGKAYDEEIENHDVAVFSDYGKGVLADVTSLIERAGRLGRPALVDPWGDDFAPYRGATAVTPNTREFEIVAGKATDDDDLETRVRAMTAQLSLGAVLVTRGEHGMSLFEQDRDTVHIPSEAREVFDVTGAGDTVVAALAAGLGCGWSMERSARLANRAAGIVVTRLGTASVAAGELGEQRIFDTGQLVHAVRGAQSAGQKVVMTNGCFDIVHAGHVSYLTEAANLGDRLVVAVNSDASVARLKGANRPINPLEHRLAVLAALRCVDWVVAFDGSQGENGFEDTPADLIKSVLPDILVKGADWREEDIVGADTMRANGGSVRTIKLVDGVSTSAIVDQIRAPAK